MLYLARKLNLPSGRVLNRYVVCVDEGEVVWWTPFETECQSMVFVEELLLSSNPDLSSCPTNETTVDSASVLYLYEIKPNREVIRIYS